MRDIRLEEVPFEIGGKKYKLRFNMNVLADVQEAYGGNIGAAIRADNPSRTVLILLAAMLNDYADEQGWDEHWTEKKVGRCFGSFQDLPAQTVMGLLKRALTPPDSETGAKAVSESDGENGAGAVSESDTDTHQAEPGTPGN